MDPDKNFAYEGTTTQPERVIEVTGRYYVHQAQAESIKLDAQAKKEVEMAVARSIDAAKETFGEHPENVQLVAEIIRAQALRDLAQNGYGNRYGYGSAVNFELKRQLLNQMFSASHHEMRARYWGGN